MTAQPPDSASPALAVEIVGLSKWFGDFKVLEDIDLAVREGERVVVCGPSGSGKSTLIRCINRLETFQRGVIRVEGLALTDRPKRIAEVRRMNENKKSAPRCERGAL